MTYGESRAASRSAEELGQNLHNRTVRLEQENKQLKARIHRLERVSIMAMNGFVDSDDYERFVQFNNKVFEETLAQSLAEHDAALLERVAKEWHEEAESVGARSVYADELIAEANRIRRKPEVTVG